MLTYIKHHIRKITEEDRWLEVINRAISWALRSLVVYLVFTQAIKISNYIPEQGPKLPPCYSQKIGNRVLVPHKTCCNLLGDCVCMTFDEFWEVFDLFKPKEEAAATSWLSTPFGLPKFPSYVLGGGGFGYSEEVPLTGGGIGIIPSYPTS